MVRQGNNLFIFPEGKVSLCTPIFPVSLLICSPTAYPVPAEKTFLLLYFTEVEEYKPSEMLDVFLSFSELRQFSKRSDKVPEAT